MGEEAEIDRLPIDLLAHIFVLITSFTDLAQYVYIYVCVSVSVLLYVLVLYHLKLNSLVLLLFNSQGEKCVQEMEAGGEAVSGSEGDSELCWLEDGR